MLPLAAAIVGRAVSVPADRRSGPRRRRARSRGWRSPCSSPPTRMRCFPSTSSGTTCGSQQDAASGFGKLGLELRLGDRLLPVGPDLGARLGTARGRRARRGGCASAGRVAGADAGPVAGACSRSTWGCRTASSAAGCCRHSRRSRCSPEWAACGWSTGCARPGTRRAALAAVSTALVAQGLVYSRARRPGALARRHAQHRARLDDGERARRLEGRGRADRPRRMVHGRGRARRARGVRPGGRARSGRRWIKFATARTTFDPAKPGAPRPAPLRERRGLRAHPAALACRLL